MSDPGSQILQHVLQVSVREEADDWLASTLSREMTNLKLYPSEWKPSSCLLADIGDVLQRATGMLSRLATGLADGSHIEMYIKHRAREANAETDFSEIRFIQYLHQKHVSLRDIASRLSDVSAEIATICDRSPASPFADRVRRSSPSQPSSQQSSPSYETSTSTGDVSSYASERSTADRSLTAAGPVFRDPLAANQPIVEDYDDSQTELQESMVRWIKALSQRGTGDYLCPLGDRCTKAAKGHIFHRNSDFKEHLEKHVKMYKCDLAGCTNTGGFARRDQLERHQKNVPHAGLATTS